MIVYSVPFCARFSVHIWQSRASVLRS